MTEYEITWESGHKSKLKGINLKDAVNRAGYNECVLEKMVSYVGVKDSVRENILAQNNYIKGIGVIINYD